MSLLLQLLGGTDCLKPVITDIVNAMAAGKISKSEAAALVAQRDANAKMFDEAATSESVAIKRSMKRMRLQTGK